MNKQELTYWITLALIPKMWTKRKNEIYVNCFQHVPQISIIDLFEDSSNWDLSYPRTFLMDSRTRSAWKGFTMKSFAPDWIASITIDC